MEKKRVTAQQLAKRAKTTKLAKRMTDTISPLGNVEVYHTLQHPNEKGEDFNEEYMLIGETKVIDDALKLLEAMFNYAERLRFNFESGITQVALARVQEVNED